MFRKLLLLTQVFLSACQPAKVTTGDFELKDTWSGPFVSGGNVAVYL